MGDLGDSPLGRPVGLPEAYDAGLLYPVERSPQRAALGITGALPFFGADHWTVWEVAWLDATGRPQVGIASLAVPCTSPRIVESKSVKLYFASLHHERFEHPAALAALLARDLSAATEAEVGVVLDLPADWGRYQRGELAGERIDDEARPPLPTAPDAAVLRSAGGEIAETLVSHAFRSVCPVTGQPDLASIAVTYAGPRIDRASLAAYLAGFRRHPGFHEHCVERIHRDLTQALQPGSLAVEARFTRRGGIDINPFRASDPHAQPQGRPTLRQ